MPYMTAKEVSTTPVMIAAVFFVAAANSALGRGRSSAPAGKQLVHPNQAGGRSHSGSRLLRRAFFVAALVVARGAPWSAARYLASTVPRILARAARAWRHAMRPRPAFSLPTARKGSPETAVGGAGERDGGGQDGLASPAGTSGLLRQRVRIIALASRRRQAPWHARSGPSSGSGWWLAFAAKGRPLPRSSQPLPPVSRSPFSAWPAHHTLLVC